MVDPANAKEDEIIVQIARQPDVTQRQLASETGISLGMTNIILKRLARKGLVKMKRLNRRNIKYVLTPSGIAHYSRRSYDYLVRTVSSVKGLKQKIKGIVLDEIDKGARGFCIKGDGELADIAELALRDLASEQNTEWARGGGRKGWVQLVCDTENGLNGTASETVGGTTVLHMSQALAEMGP